MWAAPGHDAHRYRHDFAIARIHLPRNAARPCARVARLTVGEPKGCRHRKRRLILDTSNDASVQHSARHRLILLGIDARSVPRHRAQYGAYFASHGNGRRLPAQGVRDAADTQCRIMPKSIYRLPRAISFWGSVTYLSAVDTAASAKCHFFS